jgi:hypothetical protein
MIYLEPDGTFTWDSPDEALVLAMAELTETMAAEGCTDYEIARGIGELLMATRKRQLN